MRYFIFVSFVLCYLNAQSSKDPFLQIKENSSAIGMSIIITHKDKISLHRSYGLRNIKKNLPIDENTRYRIASISKMITAVALMQLWEQKKFNLNDDISDYLGYKVHNPHFPKQKISFQNILSHTSGLRDSDSYFNFLAAKQTIHLKELLQTKGKYFSLKTFSKKDAYFQYANINYGIIATLVEKLSHTRFDIYCNKHIFKPLAIKGSFSLNDINDENIATLYKWDKIKWQRQNTQHRYTAKDLSKYKIGSNGFLFAPQGGLRVSAKELSIFMRDCYYKHTLLQKSTFELMYKTTWKYDGKNGNNYYGIFDTYALGNHTTTELLPNQILIGHPGEAYGLISDMYFTKEYGIIFITNGGKWEQGKHSGWYSIEEDVFKLCHKFIREIKDEH